MLTRMTFALVYIRLTLNALDNMKFINTTYLIIYSIPVQIFISLSSVHSSSSSSCTVVIPSGVNHVERADY